MNLYKYKYYRFWVTAIKQLILRALLKNPSILLVDGGETVPIFTLQSAISEHVLSYNIIIPVLEQQ